MRYIFVLLFILSLPCAEVLAQVADDAPLRKNDWWIGTSIGVTHTLAENATSNDFLKNYPGVELQLGTFVNSVLGFRLSMGLNPQAGRPGRAQREGDPETYDTHYNFNVLTGYLDGLVDLTTLFTRKRRKYRPTFDLMLFAGGGMLESYHFDHVKVEQWTYYPVDPWDKTFWAAHAGLMASYRIGKHWDWTLEGSYNITDSRYDGVDSGVALGGYVKLHTGWVYHFNDRTSGNIRLKNELDDSWQPSYTEKDRERAAKERAKRIESARQENERLRAKRLEQANERIKANKRRLQKQRTKTPDSPATEGLSTTKSYSGPGNWFFGLSMGTALSMAENVAYDDFMKTRVPSGSLQIGRTLTPWMSMRLMGEINSQFGHPSKVAMKYESSIYGPYTFYTTTGTLDAMFNLSNMSRKFDERNWFDLYLVLGGGALYTFGFDKKVEAWDAEIYPVSTDEVLSWTGKVGLMGAWHVAKAWDLTAEMDIHATENAYNGVEDPLRGSLDYFMTLKIGMTYYFGNSKGKHRYANPKKEHKYWKDL